MTSWPVEVGVNSGSAPRRPTMVILAMWLGRVVVKVRLVRVRRERAGWRGRWMGGMLVGVDGSWRGFGVLRTERDIESAVAVKVLEWICLDGKWCSRWSRRRGRW